MYNVTGVNAVLHSCKLAIIDDTGICGSWL